MASSSVTLLNLKLCCKSLAEELFHPRLRYRSLELINAEQQLEFPQDTQRLHLHDSKCSPSWIFDVYISHQRWDSHTTV